MILGMLISTFTTVHVIISLIGILTGLIVFWGMLLGKRLDGWTAMFLLTTVLTSVTGFMFPITSFTPALAFGIISLAVLAVALVALYANRLAGSWRWVYVVTALFALYLNVVVLVVQSFQKLAFLQPLAPTQSEPPFLVVLLLVTACFLVLGFMAARRFHPEVNIPASA